MKVEQVIVKNLNIEDRVMYVKPKKAFVSLKDHKDNFVNDPKFRLLNPTKLEICKVSKQILSRVVDALRVKTKLDLWKNTAALSGLKTYLNIGSIFTISGFAHNHTLNFT